MGAVGKSELVTSDFGWSSTRNLGKSQLGGVIFGAKNTTFSECLSKQLFGLPSQHFVYVKRIDPGLPLFLFNYSDRTLHGIFEAASSGQMNIDPYAWTNNGSQRTQYPAQVQIRVRLQCQALTENQFKPIIADNYHSQSRFWFELDHAQTSRLLSSLSSLTVSAPRNTVAPRAIIAPPATVAPRATVAPHTSTKWTKVSRSVPKPDKREEAGRVCYMPLEVDGGYSCQLNGTSNTAKRLNGSNSQPLDDCGKDEKELILMKLRELAINRKVMDPPSAGCADGVAVVNDVTVETNGPSEGAVVSSEKEEDSPVNSSENASVMAQLIEKVEELTAFKTEQNEKMGYMEQKITSLEQKLAEAETEIKNLKNHCIMLESTLGPDEFGDGVNHLDGSPERNEFHLDGSPEGSELQLDSDDLILLVGGYDGELWSSSLDCYSPSQNLTKTLEPMNTERCYAPVSKLDGELYVFGGGTAGEWYDTVASYDLVENRWTARPSLNEKKGSLAGATLNDKIYAVGGGNGKECYSAVEMLDLDVGAWIPTRSMLQKRFSLAAAELNGAIYAVGGFDGTNYLKSAERFDPREHSWTQIESMNTMRGCPSLVVLNEKLYVLGGYDGNAMVPTVEIYDPRRGSWMTGETMNYPRGFSAAAAVKDTIYIFGGLKTGEEINDSVECYKEGQGWEIVNMKAASRRCFFSAIAL